MSQSNIDLKTLKIGYWNVETVEGKIGEIIATMDRNDCDILVCVDTKRPGDNEGFSDEVLTNGEGWGTWTYSPATDVSKEFDMFWVGEKKPGQAKTPGGICVIFKPGVKSLVKVPKDILPNSSNSNAVNSLVQNFGSFNLGGMSYLEKRVKIRILPITIDFTDTTGTAVPIKLICCYAPTSKPIDNKLSDLVFKKIETEVENWDEKSLVAILGDINARLGKNDVESHAKTVGWNVKDTNKFHKETNNRGEVFRYLCGKHNLIVASLLFKSNLKTWQEISSTYNCQQSNLDHFAIGRRGSIVSNQQQIVRREQGVCYDLKVIDERTVNKDFHRLCIAKLNLEKVNSKK